MISESGIAAQVAAKLVKDRGVVAMVGNSSFVECGVNGKMYAQDDVMVIAGVGVPRVLLREELCASERRPRVSAGGRDAHGAGLQGEEDGLRDTQHPQPRQLECDGVKEWGKANGVDVGVITIDPDPRTRPRRCKQPR